MDPDAVAPMVVTIVITVTVGAVVLLRPLIKRLGMYLEVLADERRRPKQVTDDTTRIASALEGIERRLTLLEERQDFTDQLVSAEQRRKIPAAGKEPPD